MESASTSLPALVSSRLRERALGVFERTLRRSRPPTAAIACGPYPGRLVRWSPPWNLRPVRLYVPRPLDTSPRWATAGTEVPALRSLERCGLPYYALARSFADRIVADYGVPPAFARLADVSSLERAFTVHLTYLVAQRDLPFVVAALETISPARRLVLLDSMLSAELAAEGATEACLPVPEDLAVVSTLDAVAVSQWIARFSEGPDPPPGPDELRGGAALFLGSPRELPFLLPIARALGREVPLTVVTKTPIDPDPVRRAFGGFRTIDVVAVRDRIAAGCTPSERRNLVRAFQSLPRNDPSACARFGALVSVLERAAFLRWLAASRAPALVAGAFEKSAWGPLVAGAGRRSGWRVLNLQHGLVPRARVLDLVEFDAFAAWTEDSASAIRSDGYPTPESVHVVGNPAWEELRSRPPARRSSLGTDVRAWKAGSPLIVFYTQPSRGGHLADPVQGFARDALAAYLDRHPGTKLLVKPHEAERTNPVPMGALATRFGSDRVRCLPPEGLDLSESLDLADVVVAVSSTVLLDAVVADRPAVAADPTGTLFDLVPELHRVVPAARTFDELATHLDHAISRPVVLSRATGPSFAEGIEDVVRRLLRAAPPPSLRDPRSR